MLVSGMHPFVIMWPVFGIIYSLLIFVVDASDYHTLECVCLLLMCVLML